MGRQARICDTSRRLPSRQPVQARDGVQLHAMTRLQRAYPKVHASLLADVQLELEEKETNTGVSHLLF